ncbi:MAG TPA: sensor histidine kinase [Xanthomonadaceae bacterium]|nr:sensor histidine kinase [Xanthomonadaceae bacterium]
MKLSSFITRHMDAILSEWDAFASQHGPAAEAMSRAALRDHAREMLQAIALDIETSQDTDEQYEKSRDSATDDGGNAHTAATTHGAARHASQFSLLQLSSEFRALRATVLRLWLPQVDTLGARTIGEMIRFNEAIDQALAESIIAFSQRADHTQDLFLAVLGHDLRGPLASMALAGDLLIRSDPGQQKTQKLGARVGRSARLMSAMVDDLLGYTRTQLGGGMPMSPVGGDVAEACELAVADARATYPETTFELDTTADLHGAFDPVRMHQLLVNLLLNAAQYGAKGEPVLVTARRDGASAHVQVNNRGPVISESSLREIFKPLVQLAAGPGDARPTGSMGLGLFVAHEIALAHGGTLEASSSETAGTTFEVSIPLE